MKVIIQRVSEASVCVDGEAVGEIKKGLFILVGFHEDDTKEKVAQMAEKIVKLRIMPDSNDKMNLSVKDVDGSILLISQFTLYSNTSRGNRPSFVKAAKPEIAKPLYKQMVNEFVKRGIYTQTGKFGSYMHIDNILDGPVTIDLEL